MFRICLAALAAALIAGSAAAQTPTTGTTKTTGTTTGTTKSTGTTTGTTGTTSGSATGTTSASDSLALVMAELEEMNAFIADFVDLLGVEVTTPQEARMVIAFATEIYLVAKMQPMMRAAAGYGRAAAGYGGGYGQSTGTGQFGTTGAGRVTPSGTGRSSRR